MTSSFFAYLTRLRYIGRWGLKRNSVPENVMEHSWEVAVIAHTLATVRNIEFGGEVDADRVAVTALFHDASEVYTGDMPSPVKYHSPAITQAYKAIEQQAQYDLQHMLPERLQAVYQGLLVESEWDQQTHELIKAADIIAAVLKCRAELLAGNQEFAVAARDVEARLVALQLPEAEYFMRVFAPALSLTLDEMLPQPTT
jgi:5'-deoxynucleotidase